MPRKSVYRLQLISLHANRLENDADSNFKTHNGHFIFSVLINSLLIDLGNISHPYLENVLP